MQARMLERKNILSIPAWLVGIELTISLGYEHAPSIFVVIWAQILLVW